MHILRAIASIRFEDPEIELFIKQLNCKDKAIKNCIKNRLINLGPVKLLNLLLNSLKKENLSEKYEITLVKLIGYELSEISLSHKEADLIKMNHPEIISILLESKDFLIDLLISVFQEDDYQLNKSATIILELLGEEIYPILINFLNHEELVIKKNAIILIGKLKIKDAADLIIHQLDSMYEEITIAAIQALGEIGDISIIPKLLIILDIEASNFEYIDFDMKWYIIESVKKIYLNTTYPTYDSLYYSLNFDNDILKASIAIIMGELSDPKFLEPLLILITEENFEIKKNSIIALGKIGSKEAIDPLLNIIDDKDVYWLLKKVSVDAINNIFHKNKKILKNKESQLRRFFTMRIERLVDFLNEHSDEYYKVRLSIINFLESYGEKTSIKVILKYVNDFHGIVKITASKAIKNIEKRLKEEN